MEDKSVKSVARELDSRLAQLRFASGADSTCVLRTTLGGAAAGETSVLRGDAAGHLLRGTGACES